MFRTRNAASSGIPDGVEYPRKPADECCIVAPPVSNRRSRNLADINRLLKEEIARLARREIRSETERLKKASSQYRADIAALKRQVADLEKQLGRAARKVAPASSAETSDVDTSKLRYSAQRLKSQRARMDVTAADFARLLGVSAQTVYNWEAETTRPRPEQIAAIAGLRKIGKKEVRARLDAARQQAS